MKAVIRAAGVLATLGVLAASLSAQWEVIPAAGVPKLPNGEPDLAAPAPRTADGKPDFSGVWRGASTGGRGIAPPAAPAGAPPVAQFRNVAGAIKEGLPMTPWATDLLKKRMARNSKDNPEAVCLPMGIMQFHTQGMPRKFVQTPGLIVILYEASSG